MLAKCLFSAYIAALFDLIVIVCPPAPQLLNAFHVLAYNKGFCVKCVANERLCSKISLAIRYCSLFTQGLVTKRNDFLIKKVVLSKPLDCTTIYPHNRILSENFFHKANFSLVPTPFVHNEHSLKRYNPSR